MASTIIFIDSRVNRNDLIGLPTDATVIVLDPNQYGLTQIAATVAENSLTPIKENWLGVEVSLSAIHIIAHGAPGQLQLGNTILNSANLIQYQPQLQTLGNALAPDGDLFFYGCNVAATNSGQSFTQQ